MPTYSGSRPDRTLEVLLKLKADDPSLTKTENGLLNTANSLKKVEDQANRTREKMEKLANVGAKFALVGGAILAPFALSMKKYMENAQKAADTNKTQLEPTAQRLKDLSEKWEKSQERLGKVTAELVVPALEKALDAVEPLIDFIEKNPWVAGAIIGVGATLAGVGAAITLFAQTVSTIATVKGLFASATLAGATGNAAAGGAVLTAAGVQAAIAAAVPVIIGALAVWAGANLGLIITRALTGVDYTTTDLMNTVKLILALNAKGLDMLVGFFGGHTDFFGAVSDALGISDAEQARINQTIADNQTKALNSQAVSNANAQIENSNNGFLGIINAIGAFFGRKYERYPGVGGTAANITDTPDAGATNLTQNINLGAGVTLMQMKRQLRDNNRALMTNVMGAFG